MLHAQLLVLTVTDWGFPHLTWSIVTPSAGAEELGGSWEGGGAGISICSWKGYPPWSWK